MPITRKRPTKPPEYKEGSEKNSSEEDDFKDFSDSGSEASVPEDSDESESDIEVANSSGDDFKTEVPSRVRKKFNPKHSKAPKVKIVKSLYERSSKVSLNQSPEESNFSMKDLTDQNKLLPPVLNLSESDTDSSDDEKPKTLKACLFNSTDKVAPVATSSSCTESNNEFSKIQSAIMEGVSTLTDSSDEDNDEKCMPNETKSVHIAPKKLNFEHLNEQVRAIEEAKASLLKYESGKKKRKAKNIEVTELLALGEVTSPVELKDDEIFSSESEKDDWEEVKESKPNIPKEGIQLMVDFPTNKQKPKAVDLEMMMKRKLNRVKKEYQIYMHKVHVLCWQAHGNYVNKILNEQELMAAALSLLPSQHCYPSERVNIKYLEQISSWYKDTMILNQDKHENKFRPKAPPLLVSLLKQIKEKTVTTNKNLVLIFVSMLRALGIKCRLVLSFRTLPLRPPNSELCSLSQKDNDKFKDNQKQEEKVEKSTHFKNASKSSKSVNQISDLKAEKNKSKKKITNIMQLDGANDDILSSTTIKKRTVKIKQNSKSKTNNDMKDKETNKNSNTMLLSETNNITSKSMPAKSYWDELMEKQGLNDVVNPSRTSHRDLHKNNECEILSDEVSSEKSPARLNNIVNRQKASRLSLRTKTVENCNPDLVKINNNKTNKKVPPNNTEQSNLKVTTKKSTAKKREGELPEKVDVPRKKNKPALEKEVCSTNTSNLKGKGKAVSKFADKSDKVTVHQKKVNRNVASKFFKDESGESGPSQKKQTKVDKKEDTGETSNKKLINSLSKQNTQSGENKATRSNSGKIEDSCRVSHRDVVKNSGRPEKPEKNDDISLKKDRTRKSKSAAQSKIAKGKMKTEDDDDSDYVSEEEIVSKRKRLHSVNSEKDFHTPKAKPKRQPKNKIDRRVLSSDEEMGDGCEVQKKGVDAWCEVYVEEEEQWISVDVVKAQIHCVKLIYSRASHPVTYIVAWDECCHAKDLTRRYVPQFATVTRKLRAPPDWWLMALSPWLPPASAFQRREDEILDRQQLDAPLPTTVGEYKNHPLYALKRHLLKFEAIYPPDAITLGFVRGEAVYSRDCVYTLRSRETWLKEAKQVKLGEKPYKIVKARPKWDKLSSKIITDKPLEIFGPWQVMDYEPPTAENGIVPRNPYGNVELFKPCMLPKGTVHLQLPKLEKVARKLKIDCAMAMIGWDFHGGWTHPVFDGFVVCEEYRDILIDAWEKEQEEAEKRERDKIESRVYGNWKRLIKGLLIRERLRAKYDFKDPEVSTSGTRKKGKKKF